MICVIIPTLNAGDCLDGILSDLTQASVSIIVADGGSEDITVAHLGKDWALAVTLHMNKHSEKAGYFRFRAAAKGWKPRLMDFCVRWRELTFGGPYGDQGLLISRRLYEEIGGYDSVPLFEDVKIMAK